MAEVYEITRKALLELYGIDYSSSDLDNYPYMIMQVNARFGDAGCGKYDKPFVKGFYRDLAEAEKRLDLGEEINLELVGVYRSCAADYEIWHVVEDETNQDDTQSESCNNDCTDEGDRAKKSSTVKERTYSARYTKDGKVVGAYESHEINDVLSMVSFSINAYGVDGRRLFDCCNVCLNVMNALGEYGRVIFKVKPCGLLTLPRASMVEASMPAVRDLLGHDLDTLYKYLDGFSMCLRAVKYGEVAL